MLYLLYAHGLFVLVRCQKQGHLYWRANSIYFLAQQISYPCLERSAPQRSSLYRRMRPLCKCTLSVAWYSAVSSLLSDSFISSTPVNEAAYLKGTGGSVLAGPAPGPFVMLWDPMEEMGEYSILWLSHHMTKPSEPCCPNKVIQNFSVRQKMVPS